MDSSLDYFDATLESDLFDVSLESDGMDFTMDSESWQSVTSEDPDVVSISDDKTKRDNEPQIISSPQDEEFSASACQWDIIRILSLNGCSEAACAEKVHNLLPGEVQFFHNHFNSRPHLSQNQWLLEYFNANCSRHRESDRMHSYIICGKPVCRTLWLAVLGLCPKRYGRIHSLYLEGRVVIETDHLRKNSLKANEALAWMGNYFQRVGDYLPDRLAIHLPSSMTRTSVHSRMCEALQSNGSTSTICRRTFDTLWDKHYSEVSIPTENRFAKCDTCCMLKAEKSKTMDGERRKQLQTMLDQHLELQSKERQHYYRHRDQAHRNKRECMSVIIDGMDQAKTNIPHFTTMRKSGSGLWRLRTHLTGAINHGYGVHCYIDLLTWPHDANLVINVLVDVIVKREKLPPVLYLQLDNTARENKNKFLMAFLTYLVQAGVFSEIQLSFLMVGHTHEDIDQVFSRVSAHLKKNSVFTLEDLKQAAYNSNHDIVSVKNFTAIYDYKAWLTPYINTPHNHTTPHNFLFRLNDCGKAEMVYRNWSSDPWLPSSPQPGLELLKVRTIGHVTAMAHPSKSSLSSQSRSSHPSKSSQSSQSRSSHPSKSSQSSQSRSSHPSKSSQSSQSRSSHPSKSSQSSQSQSSHPSKSARSQSPPSQKLPPSKRLRTETPEAECNQLVAVLTESLEDAPWLAKVTQTNTTDNNSLKVVWMQGSYSSKWKTAKVKAGRKLVEWEDTIHAESVIVSRVTLDKDNKLNKDMVRLIKEAYGSYF